MMSLLFTGGTSFLGGGRASLSILYWLGRELTYPTAFSNVKAKKELGWKSMSVLDNLRIK